MERKQEIGNVRPKTVERKNGTMEKIASYVQEHMTEHITLRGIAAYCDVSVSTITQMFQKRLGTTFHQYLTQQRMKAADELIRTGTPLEEVGRMVGYMDHSTFYRAFRQSFGMSPREYRREIQTNAEK